MDFRGRIELGGKTATGIEIPADVVGALGGGRRPQVAVTVNGHRYRSTVASMGGRYLVPLSAQNREQAGVAAGDEVSVSIELDTEPRTVEVPDDLGAALAADSVAAQNFESCSPTHRKEWVRWVTEAKKPETRATRVSKTVTALHEGKRTR